MSEPKDAEQRFDAYLDEMFTDLKAKAEQHTAPVRAAIDRLRADTDTAGGLFVVTKAAPMCGCGRPGVAAMRTATGWEGRCRKDGRCEAEASRDDPARDALDMYGERPTDIVTWLDERVNVHGGYPPTRYSCRHCGATLANYLRTDEEIVVAVKLHETDCVPAAAPPPTWSHPCANCLAETTPATIAFHTLQWVDGSCDVIETCNEERCLTWARNCVVLSTDTRPERIPVLKAPTAEQLPDTAVEVRNRLRIPHPHRPDGFAQSKIDEIKATMLATGKRGGR